MMILPIICRAVYLSPVRSPLIGAAITKHWPIRKYKTTEYNMSDESIAYTSDGRISRILVALVCRGSYAAVCAQCIVIGKSYNPV